MSAVHVTVRVGSELYALPVGSVLEIAEVGRLTPLPTAPPGTLGLQNVHGAALPVFALATLLGISGDEGARLLVVVEDGARRAGLTVDEVRDVGELPPVEETPDHGLLSGAALTGAGLVGVLDLGRLFDDLQGRRAA
jgi:purine-binding chemotaxis protein CheW